MVEPFTHLPSEPLPTAPIALGYASPPPPKPNRYKTDWSFRITCVLLLVCGVGLTLVGLAGMAASAQGHAAPYLLAVGVCVLGLLPVVWRYGEIE